MSKLKRDDYARDDGGLWLPKYGLRGPDRKHPDSRRFMPGYPCCCECVDKYYVDSVSGGGAETGSGTEGDPWTNFNTVFSDNTIYSTAVGGECKVKVYVKGTIDYTVAGNSGRNYQRNLEIVPWDIETITIGPVAGYALYWCRGCVFNNASATGSNIGIWSCNYSTFNNCAGTGTASGFGFQSCDYSIFNTCTGAGNGSVSGYGFTSCGGSIFNTCTGVGTSMYRGIGFNNCGNSTFDTCTGNGYIVGSTGCRKACGFYNNSGASFLDCSTTDRICIGCGDCGTFTCDI